MSAEIRGKEREVLGNRKTLAFGGGGEAEKGSINR
jgi:hypothetical protein